MSDDMSAYRDVFLSESADYLQAMTDGLLTLESDPNDLEPVETVFRGAHSLKGMAAAMGYSQTQELTHKMESLMDTVRSKRQVADHTLIDLMLRAIDTVRDLISEESSGGSSVDISQTVEALVARTESTGAQAPAEGPAPVSKSSPEQGDEEGSLFRARVTLEAGCVLKGVRAYMAIKRLNHMGTVVETVPDGREIEDEQFDLSFDVILRTKATAEAVREAAMAITEVEDVSVVVMEDVSAPEAAGDSAQADGIQKPKAVPKLSETQTVRISIGHLDSIVNLVGELVIIRSRLDRIAEEADCPDLDDTLAVLERLSGELQQEVMQTRMVPVGNIFNRFPRMVRDLARDLGKDIALDMGGLDIELDRTVLDEIGDPIVHLLRNCVDHGIETAEEREAAGKPPRGTITLHADRERDQMRITVGDDGRGMDVDRILEKAVEKGLVERSARDSYSDSDVLMLVCAPGFSTVEKATRVSGRGVGMDVVKGKIEYLGGTVSMSSKPGEGTSVSLMLPLTLAIIQALLVGDADQVYALPLSLVDEVLSPDEVRLTTVDGHPVVVLRDDTAVALQRLDDICRSGGDGSERAESLNHMVLMRVGSEIRALAVERMIGRREIVIKPLSPLFRGVHGFSGATVLGDGRVALILDPRTLFVREA
ncbi:MAG: chemotaxis protein CheA [Coriobacteriia bacterium]|nr:chemotaxis protein CheA [Coriobacteriia bacterium]